LFGFYWGLGLQQDSLSTLMTINLSGLIPS